MPVYRKMFVLEDVAKLHRLFVECIDLAAKEADFARAQGLPSQQQALRALRNAYNDFKAGLDDVSRFGAVSARARISEQIEATQVRHDTGITPHLRDRIVCRPLARLAGFPTGGVGVADETVLERSGGFYWRMQEFGTGTAEAGSIIGHKLLGYFYDRGFHGPQAPDPGLFRQQAVFAPGPPIGGTSPPLPFGIGVVRKEIKGRHFIRDGAALAEQSWRGELRNLERTTLTQLSAIGALAAARRPARVP